MSSRPLHLTLLGWATLGLALAIGGLWIVHAFNLLPSVVISLQHAGWSQTIYGARPGWSWWLLACQNASPCRAAFSSAWLQEVHPWRFLLPGLLLIVAGALRVAADQIARSHHQPGAARWSLPREVARELRLGPDDRPAGYVGCIPGLMRTRVLRLPERRRCSHVVLIGGTGAGKTSRYMKPNLLADAHDGHSVVVIDVKFPDPREGLVDVIPAFLACGRDVQLFAPWHPEVTLHFPLLDGVRTLTDAMDLRDLVVGHTERRNENPFFLNLERKLLAALILGVARDGRRPKDDPHRGPATLGRIYRLSAGAAQELQRYFVTHPDAEVRAQVVGLFGLEDERLLPGIMAGLAGRLELFADPLLDRATTPTNDLREQVLPAQLGTSPTLLFIAFSQTRLAGGRGKLLLQLLIRVLNDALMRTSEQHGGRLSVHTSVYLDEFPAMGPIPGIGETLATFRSRRVAYHLALQGRAQGEEVYGITGFRAFLNNLQTVLLFPAWLKFDDARYFSEALGNATTEQLTHGTTRRGVFPHQRTTYERPVLRPLLSPEEFSDTPEDGAVLITTGLRPARVWLPRWFDRPGWLRADPFSRVRALTALPVDLNRVHEAHHRWLTARWPWVAALEPSRVPVAEAERSEPTPTIERDPTADAIRGHPVDGDAMASLAELLRALSRAPLPTDGVAQVRAFDFHGRLTKVVLSREVLAPDGAEGPARLQRWLGAGLVRPAGLELMLPEPICRRLPTELQATLRRRFGSAKRVDQAASRALPARQRGAADGTSDLPTLALETLCRWIQDHPQHFDGHPAHHESFPAYGVYRDRDLIAVSLRLATRLLTRFMHGADPKALWETWRARGWLRHDPDRFTVRLWEGTRQRRWLALTWAAWQMGTGGRASDTTREASEHETDSSESHGPAAEAERHDRRDAPPAGG